MTACTAASASGETATAHCEMIRIFSGAAVAATSTIIATPFGVAFVVSMAAFTTSQAQSGFAETCDSTTSRTLDGWAVIAAFADKATFAQSCSAWEDIWRAPKASATNANRNVVFMLGINQKALDGAGSGNRTRIASLEGWSFTTKLYPRTATELAPSPLIQQDLFDFFTLLFS
jgi:hypothetical protein